MKQKSVLDSCQNLAPHIQFKETNTFYWSPEKLTVYYNAKDLPKPEGTWALIHETAHALLQHKSYSYDLDLIILELQAWEKAKKLGSSISVNIDENHIQDCMDTYRNWQYHRSTCPYCTHSGMQIDKTTYQCINCLAKWIVSQSRFCRSYRKIVSIKKPSSLKTTVFS